MSAKMLGAEEKRWLVVGICLSKVLTPVLRKVIEQEMPQLYETLIQPPTNIHSQTFASHLKCLPPSTLRLNYININNNVTQASHKSYDYSVRDHVSLARLFVKPYMASFTVFDETLDLSAALSILCAAPTFVSYGVDTIAMDVRFKVRNEWGHCKFATWTETYYNNCFQLMENLIKILSPAFEKDILNDFEEWKNRGIDICFEQPIKDDVLKLVQDEVGSLVTSVEENKESWYQDLQGLRNNLQNLTQLLGIEIKSLEAKHEVLRSGFQRLESRHEVLEVKVSGLTRGGDGSGLGFLKSGLIWKVPLVLIIGLLLHFLWTRSDVAVNMLDFQPEGPLSKTILVLLIAFLLIFLYEHYTRGSMLRYWYSRRGCLKGGRTLSFVYTKQHQTPTVNGVEFSWENLKKKMMLPFDPPDLPGVHFYINTDRYAYGGIIPVRSLVDNLPQVLGPEVFAVNAECTKVFYEEDGFWRPYKTARNIRCMLAEAEGKREQPDGSNI